jgi:hypothetical protein
VDRKDQTRRFYRFVLPLLVAANLGLGLANLFALAPHGWRGWVQVGAGVLCCAAGGWLLGVAQARAFWRAAAEQQQQRWRRLVEVLLKWLEMAGFGVAAMSRLKAEAEAALEREA